MHIDESQRTKFDNKAWKGVFVGYSTDSHTYLVWNSRSSRLVKTRNVVFDETWRVKASSSEGDSGSSATAVSINVPVPPVSEAINEHVDVTDTFGSDDSEENSVEEDNSHGEINGTVKGCVEDHAPSDKTQGNRYPARERHPPREWWKATTGNGNTDTAEPHVPNVLNATTLDPATYTEAMKSPEADLWIEAINSEFQALATHDVWELTPLPPGRRAIGSKWVFKTKFNADGTTARHKARLVAKGYNQRYGIDYDEVFAPVVKYVSLRLILAIAAQHNWEIQQLDVDTAFLYAPVEEEIYMEQPEGFERKDEDGNKLFCRLKKRLYGTNQAGRNWNNTLDAWLHDFGFQRSMADPGVYIYDEENSSYILAVYVDDMIVVGKELSWIDHFKNSIKEKFKIKDLGQSKWILGIAVDVDKKNSTVALH